MRRREARAIARLVDVVLPVGRPLADATARDLKLMAFHPLGTARAHRDPRHGVVDEHLRVHGAEGVHVADGSAVPGPLGVNPQITIMALATPPRQRGGRMSFLIDPPWLYANGRVLARAGAAAGRGGRRRDDGRVLGRQRKPLPQPEVDPSDRERCRARSGRDWMLNSGILRLDDERAGPATHAVSAAIFATYPLWLWLGGAGE